MAASAVTPSRTIFAVAILQVLMTCSSVEDPSTESPIRGEVRNSSPNSSGHQVKIKGYLSEDGDCRHGEWNNDTQSCECHKDWSIAGLSDPLNFFDGTCVQYQCESDETCQAVLGIPSAKCAVKEWNCYCGWRWVGHQTHGARCMGYLYTFSVFATDVMQWLLVHTWMLFLPISLLLLPFGRKRANCDHHKPSLWNALRTCLHCGSRCQGACIMSRTYSFDMLKDDLAWSLYVAEVCLWLYLFMMVVYCIVLLIWSIILWLVAVVVALCVLMVGVCARIGMIEDAGATHSTGGCCGENAEGSACCCAEDAECSCCWCCCGHGLAPQEPLYGVSNAEFYWGGIYPRDPLFGLGGYGHVVDGEASRSSGCGLCCLPVFWLLYVFPMLPENAWGGFFGYFLFGTHPLTPLGRLYQGGNQVIDFLAMRWRRRADLHSDEWWRVQVRNFLTDAGLNVAKDPVETAPVARQVIKIGRAYAVLLGRPFDEARDKCFKSSFQDYQGNTCWICMGKGQEWDMWQSCHHLFCKNCSTEMLQRRMPCPLCRVVSTSVLRGQPYTGGHTMG